jgi:hypothetical protein
MTNNEHDKAITIANTLDGMDIPTDQTKQVQDDPSLGVSPRIMHNETYFIETGNDDREAFASAGMGTDEDYGDYGLDIISGEEF